MASKKTYASNDTENAADEGSPSRIEAQVREMLPSIDFQPFMDRAANMLQERPGVTIAAAVGTGFVLGVTLFSKLGRIVLAGAFGLAAELAMQKARATLLENNPAA